MGGQSSVWVTLSNGNWQRLYLPDPSEVPNLSVVKINVYSQWHGKVYLNGPMSTPWNLPRRPGTYYYFVAHYGEWCVYLNPTVPSSAPSTALRCNRYEDEKPTEQELKYFEELNRRRTNPAGSSCKGITMSPRAAVQFDCRMWRAMKCHFADKESPRTYQLIDYLGEQMGNDDVEFYGSVGHGNDFGLLDHDRAFNFMWFYRCDQMMNANLKTFGVAFVEDGKLWGHFFMDENNANQVMPVDESCLL